MIEGFREVANSMKWKVGVVLIIVLSILLVSFSGCIERPLPSRMSEVATYTANMDDDAEDELVIWFILVDEDGKQIKAAGTATYTVSVKKDVTDIVLLKHTIDVTENDFVETAIGLGSFEREATVYPFYSEVIAK